MTRERERILTRLVCPRCREFGPEIDSGSFDRRQPLPIEILTCPACGYVHQPSVPPVARGSHRR
jgi:rubredoxin